MLLGQPAVAVLQAATPAPTALASLASWSMPDRSRIPGHTSKAKTPGKHVKESRKESKLEWLAVPPVNMPDLSPLETGMPLHATLAKPGPAETGTSMQCIWHVRRPGAWAGPHLVLRKCCAVLTTSPTQAAYISQEAGTLTHWLSRILSKLCSLVRNPA